MSDCWIRTVSGVRFDLLEPTPEMVSMYDIMWSLSDMPRWNNHLLRKVTVAEHSVVVSQLVPPEDALWGLMHDASEAYVGDLPAPLKAQLPGFKAIENRIMRAICDAVGLPHTKPPSVKIADKQSQLAEARDQLPGDWQDIYGSGVGPAGYSFERPMCPEEAWAAFKNRYLELTGVCVGL